MDTYTIMDAALFAVIILKIQALFIQTCIVHAKQRIIRLFGYFIIFLPVNRFQSYKL